MDFNHSKYNHLKRPILYFTLAATFILLFVVLYTLISSTKPDNFTEKSLDLPMIEQLTQPKEMNSLSKPEQPEPEQPVSTKQSKSPPAPTPVASNREQYLIIKKGDTLSKVFQRVGLSSKTLQEVLKNNPYKQTLTRIKPNQTLVFSIENKTLKRLTLPYSQTQSLTIELQNHRYVNHLSAEKTTEQNHLVTATVQGTLYRTAKKMNIAPQLIRQMTQIFNREIDFSKDVRSGDQFTILYKAHYIENKLVKTGDILAVSYSTKKQTYQAIRHRLASGEVDYFAPNGMSLKQAFSRYPVQFSHISSMFSLSRMHPILHYRRPHQGIDLAAPIGTPIHATGDGRIHTIERNSSYGNVIKINHQNGYTSVYAHLLRFQKGLYKGSRVKRGQVIGYVGQTGLAEAPHCHYEFHVNGLPINPATVVLPRASSVPKNQMYRFNIAKNALLSQIKLFETAHLASKQRHTAKA